MKFSNFNKNIFNNSINDKVVEIIANRILTESINPKTHSPFLLEDIVNDKYREAVEDYIILNSGAI
ncbi:MULTISPECIES: hypothetical protein [Clostridium]|uniref:Uncharacterized protein n=1 Tax=Clostridium novyi (strain NT) TaxID=386415 RepID=A0PZD9_CLONN|nr:MULTISPECIES: hypothetical protein [Clostridium]ABK60617.1 hypothetical protein NT01CX_1660 [Clostridium novyi NT]KEH87507.1 hypothetical protein Z965_06185 [Clostridium novyi A str. BKT29909]KEH87673.1 hypothetical protein Z966_10285 [Clostridium novyi A str. NCTC 538]KEH88765.1 hypothetical protein Z967_00950 [Clostridium novyi A str. 4540]KEH92511.1 hypothetical protein Z963_05465 [Clostridium botulinum C/D str. It1]